MWPLFMPGVIFTFIGVGLLCQHLDERWKRYEGQMLARGIHVTRTPEWDKTQKQTANWFTGIGVVLLVGATLVVGIDDSMRRNSPSPLTFNGTNMTMGDYKACGPNPPITCPPEILKKYSNR